ncbi:MFS transporter [Phytohabitans suffuscus]|uniref:MFS transporter n=2 Tax=Phytohabitans suffuscus TaxID=624315 RepID=A0A6F8YV48_9ACTN|nr:MFS transporter [Phytohabitans suffuscus]
MFLIVSIGLFVIAVDQTVVATALAAVQADLDTGINWAAWTITVYSLGQVIVMPMAGRLSIRYGPRRILLGAMTLFTVASLCCGFANSIEVLVLLRAVQAVGAGALVPAATGIVVASFGDNRDRALGMFNSIFSVGAITGPLIGGLCVTFLSWRAVFWVNVPLGILIVALSLRYLPPTASGERQTFDALGALLFALSMLGAMLAITHLGGEGASPLSPFFLAAAASGLVLGVLFVLHARRRAEPFIPLRLIHGKGFGVLNLINTLYGVAAHGFSALAPLYAQSRYGLSPLQGGTLLTSRAVGVVAVGGLAVLSLRRTGYRLPILVGLAGFVVSLTLTATSPSGLAPAHWLAMAAAVMGVAMGITVPASNNAGFHLAPDQAPAIAGLRGMFRQTGAIVTVSVATAILSRSADPGVTQGVLFLVIAGVVLAALPLVALIPEHRGSW